MIDPLHDPARAKRLAFILKAYEGMEEPLQALAEDILHYSVREKVKFRDIFVLAQDKFLAEQVEKRQEQKASEDAGA